MALFRYFTIIVREKNERNKSNSITTDCSSLNELFQQNKKRRNEFVIIIIGAHVCVASSKREIN